jgi:DNA-binding SARP family transcriptional activator
VTTPELLELAALLVTTVLGLWLGLTVAVRSRTPAGRRFALFAISLAAWACALTVERLSSSATAMAFGHALGEVTSALAIAATADLSLAIASEGHPSRRAIWFVRGAYVVNLALAVPSVLQPTISPTALALGAMPGALYGWAWVLARIVTLGAAALWLVAALGAAGRDTLRRQQLRAALVTVLVGTVGALLRVVPVVSSSEAWIGVWFVALAIVFATYAVFSAGIFFAPAVAGRAFVTSLLGGAIVMLVVAGLVVADALGRELAGVDVPLFTVLVLVVALAVYEPITNAIRGLVAGSPRAVARGQLFQALGLPGTTTQPVAAGVAPAIQRLASTLDLTSIQAVATDGTTIAAEGALQVDPVRVPLVAGDELVGELRVGQTRAGAPLTPGEEELVRLSALYVASALRTGRREEAQLDSLAALGEARALVDQQASVLHAAFVRGGASAIGLRIHALGPLRAERGGTTVERWGGDKAGSRQAEALFAFLFDRGERGVAKDEVLEVIWPDTDLERADLAFHRTLVGLRRVLDPERLIQGGVIRFRNDRYRLDATVVAWSDVAEFERRIDAARELHGAERRRSLEGARAMYRGEYLDDCPFYGDSSYVEDRREALRARHRDLLIALGEAYETDGDRLSAAAAFREAIATSPVDAALAHAGLARLGQPSSAATLAEG